VKLWGVHCWQGICCRQGVTVGEVSTVVLYRGDTSVRETAAVGDTLAGKDTAVEDTCVENTSVEETGVEDTAVYCCCRGGYCSSSRR
jgi:hypothetical protein